MDAFAEALRFEPGFFYAPVDDLVSEPECSFRHRRAAGKRLEGRVRAHVTLVAMVIRRLRGEFRFPAVDVPQANAVADAEIEEAADGCRRHWGISPDGPLSHVGRLMERNGVIIVSGLVTSPKIDAFSRGGDAPLIFLNRTVSSTSRWHFDIAHECGHLVLHSGVQTGDAATEAAADRFASALLLPRNAFRREFSPASEFWPHVFALKRRWRVSAAAIIRRAYDLSLIGAAQYRRGLQHLSAKGWNRGEPDEPPFQEPELLPGALGALGGRVRLTLEDLCRDLCLPVDTFREVTGAPAPAAAASRASLIPFRSDT